MRRTKIIRLAGLVALALAIALVLWLAPVKQHLTALLEWVQSAGTPGLVVLGALYIPSSVLFLPAWPLTLGGGFAFGVVRGTIAASIGSVLGACAAFLAGRTLVRAVIEERITRTARFRAIDQAVADQGFKIVLLTRLSPIFPFNLLNYAFGLTKVSFRDYVLASWIGMLPGTLMYVYIGSAAKSLADVVAGNFEGGPGQTILFVVGLIATVIVTFLVTRIARRALDRAIEQGGGEQQDGSQSATEAA